MPTTAPSREGKPMDSYTITIAPNDDSGAATRLVVHTSGDQVRITDVHLHAPHGLSSGHIPAVDFDLLLRAVTGTVDPSDGRPTTGTAAVTTPQPTTPALEAPAPPDERPAPPPAGRRARKAPSRDAAAPAKRTPRTRSATAAPEKAAAAPRRKASAPAKKQPAARTAAPVKSPASGRQRRTPTATAATTGRVYRRAPDDLAAVLQQVGTVAGVAAHYQVPRYTAQGWVSRSRSTA